jgi:septal ring factor EnvC (AmiA/AmiB activator)
MRLKAFGFFGRASIAEACMLAVPAVNDYEMTLPIRHFGLFAAMSLALCAVPAGAAGETADSAAAKAQLAEVRARIASLTNRLGGELQHRDALNARLREADLSITAMRRRLDTLHGAQLAVEHRRKELRADEARVQHELAAERAALASQVRTAYMIGQQERIKLLLNQSDPASAGRMSAYYGYFARERARQIVDIDGRMRKVQELLTEIDQATTRLQALQSDTAHEVMDLTHAREERVQALAAVAQQVSSGNQELAQLKREEQAEEALVADLAQVLQDFPLDTQQSFESLRGKLAWPVQGRITARYQDAGANPASGLRRNGVLIEAAHGAKVRAPYFGRVIYADWLQGLGLLLIIGHTGNYMTLYGHAEVLYKSVGDWVAPGDVIAGLSDSSGAAPQLYFEIRERSRPEDPRAWLKATP